MPEPIKPRPDFKFRFLGLETEFYRYVEESEVNPSDVIRHFIKQGLAGDKGLTYRHQRELIDATTKVYHDNRQVSNNLNQIARKLNSSGQINKNELIQLLNETLANQREISKVLHDIFKAVNW